MAEPGAPMTSAVVLGLADPRHHQPSSTNGPGDRVSGATSVPVRPRSRPARRWRHSQSVSALAGKGLLGDRHFHQEGAALGQALTLIEAEALESVGLSGAASRRQVVVRGVRLNDLVGSRFRVGEVECLGVELCEPCRHLQQLTRPGIIKELIPRGGLNADILNDGRISVGDAVVVHGPP